MNVYAVGSVDSFNHFFVKRIYKNKEDAVSDLESLKNIVYDYTSVSLEIREMEVHDETCSDFYIVNVKLDRNDVFISSITKNQIVPRRSYSNKSITFALKNTKFSSKNELIAQALIEAKYLAREIDNDLKKLIKDYVFVKPNIKSTQTVVSDEIIREFAFVSYEIKDEDAFQTAVSNCCQPSIMLKLLDDAIYALNEEFKNKSLMLAFEVLDKNNSLYLERALVRHHFYDKDGNLAWLLYKVINGEEIFITDL